MTCVHKRAVMSQKNHRADSHNRARTEPVRQKQSIKKKKNAYALPYVSKTQQPCVRPISGTDATHVVANPCGMGKGELRLVLTLNGRQRQPSALAKHSRQPFLCPFGDTSPLP